MTGLFGGSSRVNQTKPETSLRIQTSVNGNCIPIVWGQARLAGNLIDYVDFESIAVKSNSGGGKGLGGGGGKGGSVSYNYAVAVDIAICEGPVAEISGVWNNKTLDSLSNLNFEAFLGAYDQAPWSYMSSVHPDHALNYRGMAHAGAGKIQLGNSSELPNLNWLVRGAISNSIAGAPDADPRDVVVDALTNAHYGVSFDSALLASMDVYSGYCRATGMVVSMALTERRAANDFLKALAEGTNSEFRWSNGLLDIIPYGDQNVTGNGASYTAPDAPEYSLFDDDFLPPQNGPASLGNKYPIQVQRKRASDRKNIVQVNFLNRTLDYNPAVAEVANDAAIAAYGERPADPYDYKFFCLPDAAKLSASLILGRQEIPNTYYFTVGRRFIRLDPMDIVSLNSEKQNIANQWVRIKEITENDDGSLSMIAEQYLFGTGAAPIYGSQDNSGFVPDYNVDPGDALPPAIFDVPVALAETIGLESWLATAGGVNWGGCDIWISSDDATYKWAGKMLGPSRIGVLSADLASGSDPDTTHTLAVDLTESRGTLLSGTMQDADDGNTLCFVDGEYISFQQATLTAAYQYDLGTHGATPGYLRRGQYGSQIASHAAGSLFVRLDDQVFRQPYTKDQVGTTIYVKLLSFNLYGGAQQTLDEVSSYAHVIGGPPAFYAPSGLTVVAGIKSTQLTWTNAPDIGIAATEIWRSATSSFGGASHYADVANYGSQYVDLNTAANTQYWYWIRHRDISGNESAYYPGTGSAGATNTTALAQTADIAPQAVTAQDAGSSGSLALAQDPGNDRSVYTVIASATPSLASNGDLLLISTSGRFSTDDNTTATQIAWVNVDGADLPGDVIVSQLPGFATSMPWTGAVVTLLGLGAGSHSVEVRSNTNDNQLSPHVFSDYADLNCTTWKR